MKSYVKRSFVVITLAALAVSAAVFSPFADSVAQAPQGRGRGRGRGQRGADALLPAATAVSPLPALQAEAPADAFWLQELDLDAYVQRRGRVRAATAERPVRLGGAHYAHGLASQSISEMLLDLRGEGVRFQAAVGIDDSARGNQGTVQFFVWTDDKLAFDSGIMKVGDAPKIIDIDISGVKVLQLILDDGTDTSNGDTASWGGGVITMKPGAAKPGPYKLPVDPDPQIASGIPAEPRINSPRVYGATPGSEFLFRIPASGEGPLKFAAEGLPAGLTLDAERGIITGRLQGEGETHVKITVTGPKGTATNTLTIVSGKRKLALTPPMGWNSWNSWGGSVDAEKIKAAADALDRSGLAAHGFQYVCIDDGWEGRRDDAGVLQPNQKFPDMKGLTKYVHDLGLKVGIYSSPGATTCQGLPGSLGHEEIDARTWAEWGIDYLKHDWCGYSRVAAWDAPLAEHKKPYAVMRAALDATGRDFVYSLCQYGYADVWKWGADPDVGGNMWRTTGDLLDTWFNLESVGFRQAGREVHGGPGHWNDTDMLVVGSVGWGPNLHPTRLTKNEQLLHITLWTLQAAPLMVGCNLDDLDQFTIDLLTNHEVLEVLNDPLGKSNGRVWKEGRLEVWSRPLADGTLAVGLFNRGLQEYEVSANWSDLGLTGPQPVRDLWQHKDLPAANSKFTAKVPRHGTVFVKIGVPKL
jgi:alpha-galactosidase